MATLATRTSTVNLALTRIGTSRRIMSIDDRSELANAALAVFDPALRSVTAAHEWNFAIARAALAADAEPPTFGARFKYTLPGDCLRWLKPEPGEDIYFEGQEEDGAILTDSEAPLHVRYIRLVEDAAKWSPGFEQALAYRIGLDLAYAVSALAEVSRLSEDGFIKAMREGKRLDGLGSPRRDRIDNRYSWLDARE